MGFPGMDGPPGGGKMPPMEPGESMQQYIDAMQGKGEYALSNSAWAQMFPGGATKKDITQFINQYLKNMVNDFKRQQQQWKDAQQKLKQVEQGNDPD